MHVVILYTYSKLSLEYQILYTVVFLLKRKTNTLLAKLVSRLTSNQKIESSSLSEGVI